MKTLIVRLSQLQLNYKAKIGKKILQFIETRPTKNYCERVRTQWIEKYTASESELLGDSSNTMDFEKKGQRKNANYCEIVRT